MNDTSGNSGMAVDEVGPFTFSSENRFTLDAITMLGSEDHMDPTTLVAVWAYVLT